MKNRSWARNSAYTLKSGHLCASINNSQCNPEKMNTPNNKNEQPFKINGNWDDQSKQLKTQFPQLTDADLEFETGKEDELLTKVETRLNKDRKEVIGIIRKNQEEKA
jgi:uncharacterized protein YjbJ (UPF0337 family)